jgi:hypothetical protein
MPASKTPWESIVSQSMHAALDAGEIFKHCTSQINHIQSGTFDFPFTQS